MWGGEPLNGHGAVQIVMTAHGIGDGVLMTAVTAGLQAAGRTPYLVCNDTQAGFVALFGGYERLLTAALPNAHTYVPCTVTAERAIQKPRWMAYAEVCGTKAVLPPVNPLPADDLAWAERYRGCVVISPWSAGGNRLWDVGKWKRLAFLCVSAGARAIVIDRAGEENRNAAFGDTLLGLPPTRVAALMCAAACVVGCDSGMAHVAGMLRRPVIVLNQDYKGEHIYGLYPGFKNVQGRLSEIRPEDVFRAVRQLGVARQTETVKEHARRVAEGWFDAYVRDPGIDLGCGDDPLTPTFRQWDYDRGDGDATFLHGIPDGCFATVYASHLLEHLHDPVTALRNWWRVLKPGGHLIVCVPHRDLYEKRKELPSRWNADHKTFWLPIFGEAPCTHSMKDTLAKALPQNADTVSLRVLNAGWESDGPETHSRGSYSIEAVVRKSAG